MDKILDDVRKDACKKLRESETEDLTILTDTIASLMQMVRIERNEGLIALEDFSGKLNLEYARFLVLLVADGTDPGLLLELGTNRYWTKNPQDLEAMVYYLYLRGILHIQSGVDSCIIEVSLWTLLPGKCHSLFWEKVGTILKNRTGEIAEKMLHFSPTLENTELIEKLQELEQEIKSFDDRTVRIIINKMHKIGLAICLLGLNEKAKERILTNISPVFAYSLIEDMDYFSRGMVREAEMLESVAIMLNIINNLHCYGEIR